MKLRNLLFASLAMVTFAACSNDDEPGLPTEAELPDAAPVSLTITTKAEPTKAVTKAEEQGTGNESTVTSMVIYVFNSNDGSYFAEKAVDLTTAKPNANNKNENAYSAVISDLKQTTYTFVAIASPHYQTTPAAKSDYATLMNAIQTYESQFAGNAGFVMSGQVGATLTAESKDISIELKRCLAAIELKNVKINFTADVPDNFKKATATLLSTYLINVKKESYTDNNGSTRDNIEIVGGTLYHGSSASDAYGKANNETYNAYLNQTWANNNIPTLGKDDIDVTTRFYAFPTTLDGGADNTNAEKIVLKLKVKYDFQTPDEETGETSAIRYYSIYVNNNTIDRNTLYRINATISGLGSKDDITTEGTAGNVSVDLQVLPWTVIEQNEPAIKD